MQGFLVAFSKVIISLGLSSYTPKRLYIHGLANILHNLFWNQPVQLFCSNGGVSGHINLTLFFSRECMTSQRVVAQRVPCDCCYMKGKWERLITV